MTYIPEPYENRDDNSACWPTNGRYNNSFLGSPSLNLPHTTTLLVEYHSDGLRSWDDSNVLIMLSFNTNFLGKQLCDTTDILCRNFSFFFAILLSEAIKIVNFFLDYCWMKEFKIEEIKDM